MNVIENLSTQFAWIPVDESFKKSLDSTTKRFVDARAEATPELFKFAQLCHGEGIMFGAASSKQNACVLAHRYMLFHPSLCHLFIHQDSENNGPNTLSINVTSMYGHVLIPGFVVALQKLVSIKFMTMPESSRRTSTVLHCCLETQADYNLACQFMTYFNSLHPSDFSQVIPEFNAKGEVVGWTTGDNLTTILNLAPSTGKNNKPALARWERKPAYQERKTFAMEQFIDGEFYIVTREARNCTDMTNVVPITSVIQWIVHEMENGRYNNTESTTKSIAQFKVINFDNTFKQGDVEFKIVHHDVSSGMWSIQLKDKFKIQFQPTGIHFDQIEAMVAEVEIEQQEMEIEFDSESTVNDDSSESGDCNRSRSASPILVPRQTFKQPYNDFNYHASAVQSFSNTPSPTLSTVTKQNYQPMMYFSMMPTAQAMPLAPLSFPTQPIFQYGTYGMNVQQPVLNSAPTVNYGLPNQY